MDKRATPSKLPPDWVERLKNEPLPVRTNVLQQITRIVRRDELDIAELVGWARRDPSACAYIIGTATRLQHEKGRNAPHNLEHALSLLGHGWAQRNLPSLPSLDDTIPPDDPRHRGYLIAISRALRAARHVEAWSIEQRNTAYENLVVAALVHNYLELALWRDAPDLVRQALIETCADHQCEAHSFGAALGRQLENAGIELAEVERAVTDHFYLPMQLFADEATIPALAAQHQALVQMARRMAFVSERGWYHPSMIALKQQLAAMLNRDLDSTERLVHDTALRTARNLHPIGLYASARLLPAANDQAWPFPDDYGIDPELLQDWMQDRPAPAIQRFNEHLEQAPASIGGVFKALIETVNGELGLPSIALYLRGGDGKSMMLMARPRHDSAPPAPDQFAFDDNRLIARLFTRPQSLKMDPGFRESFAQYLSEDIREHMQGDALLFSFVALKKPVALIIAQNPGESVSESIYSSFTELGLHVANVLRQRLEKPAG